MSITNHISIELNDEEKQALLDHLIAIEKILASKLVNIPDADRSRFNRIGDGNYPLVEKTAGYKTQNPQLIASFMSESEFDKDFAARNSLSSIHKRINALNNSLDDTLRYLDTDIWNFVLTFYQNTKYLAKQGVSNASTVYEDLSKRFPGRPKKMDKTIKIV